MAQLQEPQEVQELLLAQVETDQRQRAGMAVLKLRVAPQRMQQLEMQAGCCKAVVQLQPRAVAHRVVAAGTMVVVQETGLHKALVVDPLGLDLVDLRYYRVQTVQMGLLHREQLLQDM